MKPWVYRYDFHLDDAMLDPKKFQALMDDMERAAIMVMLHCWATGLYAEDGWEITRTEWRGRPYGQPEVYTLSVRNKVTGHTPEQLRG